MKTQREIRQNQTAIILKMQKDGYNVQTCPNCGDVVLTDTLNVLDMIVCPHCMQENELCEYPDLYHQGWENSFPDMITPEQARKNSELAWKKDIDYELKDILKKIKEESTGRRSVENILYHSINETNVEKLKAMGYTVYQHTFGASKFEWTISWSE